jgi:hypothetical protein
MPIVDPSQEIEESLVDRQRFRFIDQLQAALEAQRRHRAALVMAIGEAGTQLDQRPRGRAAVVERGDGFAVPRQPLEKLGDGVDPVVDGRRQLAGEHGFPRQQIGETAVAPLGDERAVEPVVRGFGFYFGSGAAQQAFDLRFPRGAERVEALEERGAGRVAEEAQQMQEGRPQARAGDQFRAALHALVQRRRGMLHERQEKMGERDRRALPRWKGIHGCGKPGEDRLQRAGPSRQVRRLTLAEPAAGLIAPQAVPGQPAVEQLPTAEGRGIAPAGQQALRLSGLFLSGSLLPNSRIRHPFVKARGASRRALPDVVPFHLRGLPENLAIQLEPGSLGPWRLQAPRPAVGYPQSAESLGSRTRSTRCSSCRRASSPTSAWTASARSPTAPGRRRNAAARGRRSPAPLRRR